MKEDLQPNKDYGFNQAEIAVLTELYPSLDIASLNPYAIDCLKRGEHPATMPASGGMRTGGDYPKTETAPRSCHAMSLSGGVAGGGPVGSGLALRDDRPDLGGSQAEGEVSTSPVILDIKSNYEIDKERQWNGDLTRQQGLLFKKLNSGFAYNRKKSDEKFITLTSSTIVQPGQLWRDYALLVKRIRTMTPWKFYKRGYLTESEMKRYYRGKDLHAAMTFEYCAIETDEGNGVLHIPCKTGWIPKKYLDEVWKELHMSSILDIRWCRPKKAGTRDGGTKGLAGYCLQNYLIGHTIIRSSSSRHWLRKGYRQACKTIWKMTQDKKEYIWYLIAWNEGRISDDDLKRIAWTRRGSPTIDSELITGYSHKCGYSMPPGSQRNGMIYGWVNS